MSCGAIAKRRKLIFIVKVKLISLISVPYVNAVLFAKLRILNSRVSSQYSSRIDVVENAASWNSEHTFRCKFSKNHLTTALDPKNLKVSIRMEAKGGKSFSKLGFVIVNLSCFAASELKYNQRGYILEGYDGKKRLDNSLLILSVNVSQLTGDSFYEVPHEDKSKCLFGDTDQIDADECKETEGDHNQTERADVYTPYLASKVPIQSSYVDLDEENFFKKASDAHHIEAISNKLPSISDSSNSSTDSSVGTSCVAQDNSSSNASTSSSASTTASTLQGQSPAQDTSNPLKSGSSNDVLYKEGFQTPTELSHFTFGPYSENTEHNYDLKKAECKNESCHSDCILPMKSVQHWSPNSTSGYQSHSRNSSLESASAVANSNACTASQPLKSVLPTLSAKFDENCMIDDGSLERKLDVHSTVRCGKHQLISATRIDNDEVVNLILKDSKPSSSVQISSNFTNL